MQINGAAFKFYKMFLDFKRDIFAIKQLDLLRI